MPGARRTTMPMRTLLAFSRKLLALCWYALLTLLILGAVAFTAARLLLPEIDAYRGSVEQWASEAIGRPVAIEALDARLLGLGFSVGLQGVRLLDANGAALMAVDTARLEIDGLASLRERRLVPRSLTVVGPSLSVTRHADGRLTVAGVGAGAPGAAGTGLGDWLFAHGAISIERGQVRWRDLTRTPQGVLEFTDVDLQLRNDGPHHLLEGSATLPARLGQRLQFGLDIRGDMLDPAQWVGQGYLDVRNLELGDTLLAESALAGGRVAGGRLDLRLWADWSGAGLTGVIAEAGGREVKITIDDVPGTVVERLTGNVRWTRQADGWLLEGQDLALRHQGRDWAPARFRVVRDGAQPLDVQAFLSAGRIEGLASLATALLPRGHELVAALGELRPVGGVRDLRLTYRGDAVAPEWSLQAELQELSARPWGSVPGVQRVSGLVRAGAGGGSLRVDSSAARVVFPRLFRAPLSLGQLRGDLSWERVASGWQISVAGVEVSNDDIAAELSGQLTLGAQHAPGLDLEVAFHDGRAERVAHYLPVGIMGEPVVAWLDRAFAAGRIERGTVLFRGPVDRFPFRDGDGRFEARFTTRAVTLDYQPGWPVLSGVDAEVVFDGPELTVQAHSARLRGSQLSAVRAHIPDLERPVLAVAGEVAGPLQDVVHILTDSPLQERFGRTLGGVRATGASRLSLGLRIPLMQAEGTSVSASLALLGNDVHLPQAALDIEQVQGVLRLEREELSAEGLRGRLLGGPIQASITPVGDRWGALVSAEGEVAAEALEHYLGMVAGRGGAGRARWQGALVVPRAPGAPPTLQLRSELKGLAVHLPAPLTKTADSVRPLLLEIQPPDGAVEGVVRARYGDIAQLVLALSRQGARLVVERGALTLGGGAAELPEARQLRITGRAEGVALGGWSGLWPAAPARDIDASWRPWQGAPLVIALARLQLQPSADASAAEPKPGRLDPRTLPPITAHVQSLGYGDTELGTLRAAASPGPDGVVLDHLRLTGAHLELRGQGTWEWRGGTGGSALALTAESRDVGRALGALGFASVLQGGKARVIGDLRWPGSPADYALERLEGTVAVHVTEGRINEVDPGAGRLFGLFGLSALPRRLVLDFRDVFAKGFVFDEVRGTVALGGGDAHTEGLLIDGPAAKVLIQGRTGLVARDYNQLVTVIPKVGDSLPLAGGLAWGPQVGAVIFVVQRLLRSQIDLLAQFQYRVTGSWEEPVVVRLAEPGG